MHSNVFDYWTNSVLECSNYLQMSPFYRHRKSYPFPVKVVMLYACAHAVSFPDQRPQSLVWERDQCTRQETGILNFHLQRPRTAIELLFSFPVYAMQLGWKLLSMTACANVHCKRSLEEWLVQRICVDSVLQCMSLGQGTQCDFTACEWNLLITQVTQTKEVLV